MNIVFSPGEIHVVTGKRGSGKSLWMVSQIVKLARRIPVYTNIPLEFGRLAAKYKVKVHPLWDLRGFGHPLPEDLVPEFERLGGVRGALAIEQGELAAISNCVIVVDEALMCFPDGKQADQGVKDFLATMRKRSIMLIIMQHNPKRLLGALRDDSQVNYRVVDAAQEKPWVVGVGRISLRVPRPHLRTVEVFYDFVAPLDYKKEAHEVWSYSSGAEFYSMYDTKRSYWGGPVKDEEGVADEIKVSKARRRRSSILGFGAGFIFFTVMPWLLYRTGWGSYKRMVEEPERKRTASAVMSDLPIMQPPDKAPKVVREPEKVWVLQGARRAGEWEGMPVWRDAFGNWWFEDEDGSFLLWDFTKGLPK